MYESRRTTERTTSPGEEEFSITSQGTQALAQLSERIAPRFKRAEVRKRVGRYLRGLLASVERKNGWQMAEELVEPNAHGVQRLLAEADWDEEAVRDDLRAYVIEHLGEAGGMLVMDETGFLKKGKKSAGVARQYSGTAGRRENSQVGVFLVYSSPKGAAFIDRALYLPEEWTSDRVRCREAGIPDEVEFATKGELAQAYAGAGLCRQMLQADWVIGDTVYGYDELRIWLDEQQKNYVLAVPETHTSGCKDDNSLSGCLPRCCQRRVGWSCRLVRAARDPGCTNGRGCSCRMRQTVRKERARWLLIRRSLADPEQASLLPGSRSRPDDAAEVVRVAGSRWKIEEGYEQAKGEVGLDQYEVRTWRAWYRYMTLASARLRRPRRDAGAGPHPGKKRGETQERIALSVPEVRRLLHALGESEEQQKRRLHWSRFRRQHQARAQRFHRLRRARQAPAVSSDPPAPLPLLGIPELTDEHWEQLRPLLPPQKPRTGRPAVDHRLVVEGMLWVARSGLVLA